jgi:hypothetical protein
MMFCANRKQAQALCDLIADELDAAGHKSFVKGFDGIGLVKPRPRWLRRLRGWWREITAGGVAK